jgi:hypothetical protein
MYLFFVVAGLLHFFWKQQLIWPLISDHDRPLSKTGKADAISVSDKFQQMGWIPELILCRYILILQRICVHRLGFNDSSRMYNVLKLQGAIWLRSYLLLILWTCLAVLEI